jgi:archaemetzincin
MVPGPAVVKKAIMRKAVSVLAMVMIALCSVMGFEPPGPQQRLEAIGPTNGLSVMLRRALAPSDSFEPVPVPGASDWLAVHREPGQTFEQFRRSGPSKPDAHRRIIYLQPLGAFPERRSPCLEKLREYAAAFFQMEVEALPPMGINAGGFTSRTNAMTGRCQILTEDVLRWLKGRFPGDGFCMLAITMEDLYPEPSWNFVFGQASLTERVGVYSFARYDPAFYGEVRGKDYQALLLRRSMKVLTHETGHMFGLAHCIHFSCVMNGSNHLQESDHRPLHLCPACLRKVQLSVGFDAVKRYRDLASFDKEAGFADEAGWLAKRLAEIRFAGQ